MANRKSAPATKQDLRSSEGRMNKHVDATIGGAIRESETRMTANLDRKLTQAITESEARLTKHFDHQISRAITDSEERILGHFDLTVENIRHDLLGANPDRIELLHDRIAHVEQHVGLTPA